MHPLPCLRKELQIRYPGQAAACGRLVGLFDKGIALSCQNRLNLAALSRKGVGGIILKKRISLVFSRKLYGADLTF